MCFIKVEKNKQTNIFGHTRTHTVSIERWLAQCHFNVMKSLVVQFWLSFIMAAHAFAEMYYNSVMNLFHLFWLYLWRSLRLFGKLRYVFKVAVLSMPTYFRRFVCFSYLFLLYYFLPISFWYYYQVDILLALLYGTVTISHQSLDIWTIILRYHDQPF